MHMADALVAPAVAGTMYALSAVAEGYSVRQVRLTQDETKIPVMGVMGAFVFAAQMINFAIPGTGASGHLCGGILLSAVLGPCAGFLTMTVILLIQCLLFADGGLLALGCNIWNMAFYSCFVGGFLIWRLCMRKGISKKKIVAASMAASIVTLQLGAFSVTLETLLSGITELPFWLFAAFMQPIHLVIGMVEGLITAALLVFLYEARPELLWGFNEAEHTGQGSYSLKSVLAVLFVSAAVLAGGISLFASTRPDGLEWSVERVTGKPELALTDTVQEAAASVQEKTAVLPDYSFGQEERAAGTAVSGLLGGAAVVILCVAGSFTFRFFKYDRAGNRDSRERREHE